MSSWHLPWRSLRDWAGSVGLWNTDPEEQTAGIECCLLQVGVVQRIVDYRSSTTGLRAVTAQTQPQSLCWLEWTHFERIPVGRFRMPCKLKKRAGRSLKSRRWPAKAEKLGQPVRPGRSGRPGGSGWCWQLEMDRRFVSPPYPSTRALPEYDCWYREDRHRCPNQARPGRLRRLSRG